MIKYSGFLVGLIFSFQSISFATESKQTVPFSDPEKNFQKLIELLKTSYYDASVSEEELYQFAAQGMIQGLNNRQEKNTPENRLLPPAQTPSWIESPTEEVVGVGIELEDNPSSGHLRVIRVVPQGAADKGGIERGDQIIRVGGKKCQGIPLNSIVDEIRGKTGTSVQLEVLRNGKKLTKKLLRERMIISRYFTSSFIFESGIGYLRVDQFLNETPEELKKLAHSFNEKKIKKVMIDLRNCSGGHLDKTIEAAGLFLPAHTVALHEESRGKITKTHKTGSSDPLLSSSQIAILIGDRTAAGCEAFVASLIDNQVGILIGQPTHGWSDLETHVELPNHFSVQFVTAALKRKNGEPLKGKGFEPKILVSSSGPAYVFDPENKKLPIQKQINEDPVVKAAVNYLQTTP